LSWFQQKEGADFDRKIRLTKGPTALRPKRGAGKATKSGSWAEIARRPLLAMPPRIRTASLPASPARTGLRSLSLEAKADRGGLSDELMV
jgi:hypothetical protein